MARFKVVVTDHVFANLEPERKALSALDVDLVEGRCKSRDDIAALVPGADAMLNCYYGPIDGDVMDLMPQCRIIARYGIGVDTIDIQAATERGIMVANVPNYCINEVSDHAVAMAMALLRKLPQADRSIRDGAYGLASLSPMRRVSSLTVGIIGMGRIGRAIVERLRPFGPAIVFYDPYLTSGGPDGTRAVGFRTLLSESDAIIVQAPATAETRRILNEDAFALMAKKPVIVNCARGELIDTDALIRALEDGRVSGAGLDVIDGTPPIPAESPLLRMSNVILTPHSAWFSGEALTSLQALAAEEVGRALRGERPESLLNSEGLSRIINER